MTATSCSVRKQLSCSHPKDAYTPALGNTLGRFFIAFFEFRPKKGLTNWKELAMIVGG